MVSSRIDKSCMPRWLQRLVRPQSRVRCAARAAVPEEVGAFSRSLGTIMLRTLRPVSGRRSARNGFKSAERLVVSLEKRMNFYTVQFEIAGPTAMWTRPDTGDAPVSYPVPTFSAAKGMFEFICWLKSANVVPVKVEICAPLVFHTYSTNYGGPLRKSKIMGKGEPPRVFRRLF